MIESIGSGRTDTPEEAAELSRILTRLADAKAGKGSVAYVEGAAASGKTQLLSATAEAGRAAGMRVLDARGHPLERAFPFGVAIQLFEETWLAACAAEQTALRDGPTRPAVELMSGALMSGAFAAGPPIAGERLYAVIHGLFWLARALTGDGKRAEPGVPLALIVDDIDDADEPSLRFLAYLASRIGRLPIALVVAARPASPSEDAPALSALRSASELRVFAPSGAGSIAVATAAAAPSAFRHLEPAAAGGARGLAAQMALRKSLADAHRESVIDLAELAWGDGALLESDEDADAWPAVAGSLLFVDELERAVEIAHAATGFARAGGTPCAAHYCRGWSLYHQGRIMAAFAVAEAALAGDRNDPVGRGLLAACRLAQGRLDAAESALPRLRDGEGIDEINAVVLLDLRAQLRLAQLRPVDALADALEAGRRSRGTWGRMGPGVVAWRSTAAMARLALGDRDRARALVEEELELARERGLQRVIIRDLRMLAFAATGTRSLDLLTEAVRVGRAAPPRLEYMHALVDLGAATRRANQRTAARHALRTGLDLAERGAATALARRATEELAATGARPRGVVLSGVKALTPSERRVADLAADGLRTRQIAQVLSVTPKTVEFHLRHIYRKLDIPSSRADLARALPRAPAG